jgi:hypothetical protein
MFEHCLLIAKIKTRSFAYILGKYQNNAAFVNDCGAADTVFPATLGLAVDSFRWKDR